MTIGDPLPAELVELIARAYGQHVATSWRFDAGDEAHTWRAEGERELFVHESPSWRTAAELAWCHTLVRRVATAVPEAVPPLRTSAGQTFVQHAGALVTLYPWRQSLRTPRALFRKLDDSIVADELARMAREAEATRG